MGWWWIDFITILSMSSAKVGAGLRWEFDAKGFMRFMPRFTLLRIPLVLCNILSNNSVSAATRPQVLVLCAVLIDYLQPLERVSSMPGKVMTTQATSDSLFTLIPSPHQ
jgi:hypothetical protein